MPLRTLIVDDEPIGRNVLREELDQMDGVQVIGEAESGVAALELIGARHPDLVFLDLQMPGMNGLDVVKQIGGGVRLPVFIIVTAYDHYAIQAFESGAIDYLLKPIRQERLVVAIEKANRLLARTHGAAHRVAALQEIAGGGSAKIVKRIVAKSGSEYLLLNSEEVLAFQAEGDLVWVITGKKNFLATETLRKIQEKLEGTSFKRIHRKALVNIDHIRKMSPLTSQRWLLTLSNNLEFIVSKRQAKNARDILSW
jgi:two-component system LytT family response regulator